MIVCFLNCFFVFVVYIINYNFLSVFKALCKNPIDNSWKTFNDSDVSSNLNISTFLASKQCQTEAYILIYTASNGKYL